MACLDYLLVIAPQIPTAMIGLNAETPSHQRQSDRLLQLRASVITREKSKEKARIPSLDCRARFMLLVFDTGDFFDHFCCLTS
jgi:hypothetical protein